MKSPLFRILSFLTILVMASWACTLGNNSPTPNPNATKALKVIEEAGTQTAQAKMIPSETSAPPSETPAPPTDTPLPAATATDTLTPEPSITPTEAMPIAEVVSKSNCRTGPAGGYDLVASYLPGQKLNVLARDLGGGFVFVQNPDKPEDQCYILANNIKISGDTTALPQYTPPPSPTAAPAFTVQFQKFDMCQDNPFAIFTVVNTGSVQFRSAYVKVTDLKVNKAVEQSLNAFDLVTGCIVAQNIAPLKPGGTGYLQSPQFKWDPRPNKLHAIIMVCTDQGLKGTCVTQTLDFKNK